MEFYDSDDNMAQYMSFGVEEGMSHQEIKEVVLSLLAATPGVIVILIVSFNRHFKLYILLTR